VAEKIWKPIATAPKGIGDVLLRNSSDPYQTAYVGRQYDDGRWRFGDAQDEVRPAFYCLIPQFDADDVVSS
jgi:hypothetical protein